MRTMLPLLALLAALGCRDLPSDAWSAEAAQEGQLSLSPAPAAELSLLLTLEGDLAEGSYIDTGGDEVTTQPEAQSFTTGWRLTLTPAEAGNGALRVLFYSDTDAQVPAVTDIAADSSGGSALSFDATELECVFEPETWNVCTRHLRVRVERKDEVETDLSWTLTAWAEGADGTASVVEEARLTLGDP